MNQNNIIITAKEMNTFYGLYIRPNKGETVRECLDRCTHFALPAMYQTIDMEIILPCGNRAFYKTLDDVPVVDTPCLCGNPEHYFVKIGQPYE